MRMHRGSSKGGRGEPSTPGTLPLSASPSLVAIEIRVVRASAVRSTHLELPAGAVVRDAVRAVGLFAEGCAARVSERSVPMDRPLRSGEIVELLPTFSGG